MDNSTSIADLPIDNNHQPETLDMPSRINVEHSREQNINMDVQVIPDNVIEKKVSIDEKKNKIINIDNEKPVTSIHKKLIIDDTNKIILLSTLVFLIFQDSKVRNYILNILCQIFGSYLKTPLGNISKVGYLFYSSFFGITLFLITKIIDISSINLAF